MNYSRRDFLKTGGLVSIGFLGLRQFSERLHAASVDSAGAARMPTIRAYGPLEPDPEGIFDLPKGFSYRVIARKGERLDDGFLRPGAPDGMAAFSAGHGRVALICNHELSNDQLDLGPYGLENELFDEQGHPEAYDRGRGQHPSLGGTTTLIYNPETRRIETQFLSLAGTNRNCAGGPTPWNSWITCEEDINVANEIFEKDHGYNFEVPVSTNVKHVEAVPLKAMGRFNHEAVAVDPASGIVYQTEDAHDGLIYRFIPNTPEKLHEGGRLQALAIKGNPSRDTRNWPDLDADTFPASELLAVEWIDIEDVESPDNSLRHQGFAKGAARFARGEGMWYGNGEVFFACTNGGSLQRGQIFRYIPGAQEGRAGEEEAPGKLELFVESKDDNVLKNCDNLTIAPNGHLIVCEDSSRPSNLVGITPSGESYLLGSNAYTGSELAGACFSPDGKTLFLNLQWNGMTLAITGPWGALEG